MIAAIVSVFKNQKSLFQLLDVHNKNEVDEGAVIQAARQNPEDLDRIFYFKNQNRKCCREGYPLHKAIELDLGIDVIKSLISPFAIRLTDNLNLGWTALHRICQNDNPSLEVLSVVLKAYPEAAREKDYWDRTPLHLICGNRRASLEMVSMMMKAYPEAAREKDIHGCTPLHLICGNRRTSLGTLIAVLNAWPEATRKKDILGGTPLHLICGNRRASLEMLSTVLKAYPEAAREKDNRGSTPLHIMCVNKSASLKMVQTIADALVEGKGNRTSHS
eukprot:9445132-Ditylum_brightwellii.AAC.1